MLKKIVLTFTLLIPGLAFSFDGSGLQISLAGDMVYDTGLNSGSSAEDKLAMRGAEIMFYTPVDHNFDGVLSAAAHDENGETVFELHELYLSSNKLIPRGRVKAGQFFLGVGRLNQIHQHDWPFIRAPKVHETFFDSEGVFDAGIEFGYLLPTDSYWDLSFGLTSGHRYGHAHTAGSKPSAPTHYVRLETFKELSASTDGLKIGFNYLGRTDEQKNSMSLGGIDLVAKWRDGKRLTYLLQSEAWYRSVKDINGDENQQVGLYVFNQFGLSDSLLIGARLDGFKDLSKRNSITDKKINNVSYAISPELTWKSSEFATFRAGFSHSFTKEEGKTIEEDTRFELQLVFILGAHPAHNF